ncbi:hypothetical protein DR864_28255 (plasmid) [Runella rosea]|uniref:Uncharacterized protein n=2 Tax=Runella rosea TaxID=2259595 RepID=A0A344TT00_9BACT|nr:hypothetical protein DR864_28255 [Runella rosea]
MNPIDFEKTQIFANKAKAAATPPSPPLVPQMPSVPQVAAAKSKPNVKKLTKEEKILLATGGVLSIGLGAIVFASFSDSVVAVPVVATTTTLPDTAPVIETEPTKTPDKPITTPAPHHTVPTHHTAHSNSTANGTAHSLIDIPEEPQVSDKVSDEMSFDEAFKAARNDVGPGGLFVWNETYYGTFSESEWESLPEAKKEQWITAVEPVIDPIVPVEDPIAKDEHVVIADRGEITWTGIDKNGDGFAEVLTARVQGQPPIVMMDADNDGMLDTRYFLDTTTGQVASAPMEQTVMEMSDVNDIPQIEAGSSFHNAHYENTRGNEDIAVSIFEKDGIYLVAIDMDGDALMDIFSLNADGEQPFVAMDMDNDGQVETGYVYSSEHNMVVSSENEPMEPFAIPPQELFGEETYTADADIDMDDDTNDDDDSADQYAQSDTHGNTEENYFNNQSDAADDFVA